MKLTKAKKERLAEYIDMMQFNCDIRSCYSKEDFDDTMQALNGILEVNCYIPFDKPMLNLLEKRYKLNNPK
jgi:hypothetical protein